MRAPARAALTGILAAVAAGCDARPSAALLAAPTPIFRGHQDVRLDPSGEALPHVLGRATPIGLCLDAPPGADTSQWEASFSFADHVAPVVRLDTTVCFETAVPENVAPGDARLCATLRDRFDGRTQALGCLPFRLDVDEAPLRALEAAIPAALSDAHPVARLDTLAEAARAQEYPALALRLSLIAVYTLRREGSPAARADAERRLRGAPAWVERPFAARWAGQVAYEWATLRLDADTDLAGCWGQLRLAERSFRASGDRKWIAVRTKQAEVLSRAGALGEAKDRLRFAIGQCATAPCDAALLGAAENTLSWLAASDPDATDAELASSEAALRSLLASEHAPGATLEQANLHLNLALVHGRRGQSPEAELAQARTLLGGPPSSRARELAGWADLVAAQEALRVGRPAQAADMCDRLGREGESARIRAYGLGCAAAAHRRLGALERADERLAQALTLHASLGAVRLGQDVPLGPGRRAEDVYAAARVRLELGDPAGAWAILRALDDDVARTPSPPSELTPALATLAELERPSSAPRRAQRQPIRQGTLDRIQERLRAVPGGLEAAGDDGAVRYRAFPLDDEIVVLRRTPEGEIVPYRRVPMPRAALVGAVRGLSLAMERQEQDDARWIALAKPLAEALVPRTEDLEPVTTFAMHGILQEVPLAALPLPPASERRWLGEVTAVAWHPAGAAGPGDEHDAAPHPQDALFVLDPRGDLGLAGREPAGARGPGARVLEGAGATREALRAALPGAGRLHVEAHARYEPGFPELSTLVLADGPVTGQELAAWTSGLTLANLSGCATGRSPVSADSGRFGISGLLARRGVTWVVGARVGLSNALALDFNRAFEAALAGGEAVPEAYRHALGEAGRRHPASQWGALLLLHTSARGTGGQSPAGRTPSLAGGVP